MEGLGFDRLLEKRIEHVEEKSIRRKSALGRWRTRFERKMVITGTYLFMQERLQPEVLADIDKLLADLENEGYKLLQTDQLKVEDKMKAFRMIRSSILTKYTWMPFSGVWKSHPRFAVIVLFPKDPKDKETSPQGMSLKQNK